MAAARKDDILKCLRSGDRIAVQYPDPMKKTDATCYWLVSNGKKVTPKTFMALWPNLEPVGDGMFGGSQTYRLRA